MSLEAQTVSQIVDQVLALPKAQNTCFGPNDSDRKGEHLYVFQELKSQGFTEFVDGLVVDLDEVPTLDKKKSAWSMPSSIDSRSINRSDFDR